MLLSKETPLPLRNPNLLPLLSGVQPPQNQQQKQQKNPQNKQQQKQRQQQQPQPQQPQPQQPQQPKPITDLRVLIRLDPGSPTWKKSKITVRSHLAQLLKMPLNRIPGANLTTTGWAIHASDQATQREIINRQAEWAPQLGAIGADIREVWHTYIIHNCPRTLLDWEGTPLDYNALFREEVIAQTGQAPTNFKPTKKQAH